MFVENLVNCSKKQTLCFKVYQKEREKSIGYVYSLTGKQLIVSYLPIA